MFLTICRAFLQNFMWSGAFIGMLSNFLNLGTRPNLIVGGSFTDFSEKMAKNGNFWHKLLNKKKSKGFEGKAAGNF